MKKIFILTVLFVIQDMYSQQSGKIIYHVIMDTTQNYYNTGNREMNHKLKQQTLSIYEVTKNIDFILKYNNKESIYQIDDPMRDESISVMDFTLAKLLGGGSAVYYQNAIERQKIQQYYEAGKSICELDTLNQNWQITNITGTLGKFKVIKATSGNVTAWFTPEIPVPFGPMGYGGLPGLILKIQIKMRILVADKIVFLNRKLKITKPKGELHSAKEMAKKRFEEIAKQQNKFK